MARERGSKNKSLSLRVGSKNIGNYERQLDKYGPSKEVREFIESSPEYGDALRRRIKWLYLRS
jgi:hypothetical protein